MRNSVAKMKTSESLEEQGDSGPYSSMIFPEFGELLHHWRIRAVIEAYPQKDSIIHIQYLIYNTFWTYLGVCLFVFSVFLGSGEAPKQLSMYPTHRANAHSPWELVAKAGREAQVRRREVIPPDPSGRAGAEGTLLLQSQVAELK